jgi:hypothetical protein
LFPEDLREYILYIYEKEYISEFYIDIQKLKTRSENKKETTYVHNFNKTKP